MRVADKISLANRKYPRGEDHGVSTPWMRDPSLPLQIMLLNSLLAVWYSPATKVFAIREILAGTMDRICSLLFAQPDCGADDECKGPGWGYLEGWDIFVLVEMIF